MKRATKGSAGYDICSPVRVDLKPGTWVTIDTGESFDSNDIVRSPDCGWYTYWFMMIVPRSGLSNRYGLKIKNTVAIIDQDYRDTIKLTVTTETPYTLQKGERFAQGILLPYGVFNDEIAPTESRNGGFGSTGRLVS